MELVNPTSLYSGAAQVFNNKPHLEFQARLLAQHQAKMDALDNYYRRLPLTINEKGVRDQEREPIANGMNAIKQFYLENKDKLKKGDQSAGYNYEKMIREQQDLIGRSQNAGLTSAHVGKLKFSPNTAYMFQSPDTIQKLSAHELPLTDPNHVDFDLDDFVAPPKPYDRTGYFKNFATLKGNDNKTVVKNPDGITQTEINTPSYEEPQKQYVMSVAADKYLHDPSFTQMVNNDLGAADATNPLNSDFKQHFGHDIQTPIDLATAYTFNGLKPTPITQKITTDRNALMNKQLANSIKKMNYGNDLIKGRMRLSQNFRKAMVDYKSAKDSGEQEGVLNKFIHTAHEAGSNKFNGTEINGIKLGGNTYEGKFIDVPHEVKYENRVYQGKDKDGKDVWKYPDAYYLTNDEKTFIPMFFDGKTNAGNLYVDPKLSTPKDVQMLKVPLAKTLLTKKQTGGEVTNNGDDDFTSGEAGDNNQETIPQPKETSPSYTREDYKAAGWTDKQINIATKAGKIKIK